MNLIDRSHSILLLVDMQERLLPAMHQPERVQSRSLAITQGAALLGVPILCTEQYRKGLGPTVSAVAQAIPGFCPIEKLEFSAFRAPGLAEQMAALRRKQVLLAGIECHVCVLQTCLDLFSNGYEVFVIADATSSRSEENLRLGLERMKTAGAVIASSEMALFEMLGRAGTPEFKQILGIVK